jgi:PAS domain S-box-containing protein
VPRNDIERRERIKKDEGELQEVQMEDKTKKQLMEEIESLRREVAKLKQEHAQRKQVEEAPRETKESLSKFLQQSPDLCTIWDSDLNLIEASESSILVPPGTKKEDFIGKNILEIAPGLKETGRYDQYLEIIKTGKTICFDDVIPHPQFGDLHMYVRAFKAGDGLGMIVTDITERKRVEEALRRTEKQASTAIEAARGFTFSFNIAAGKIIWGGAIEEITGYTPEEYAEVDIEAWAERIHPEDRDGVLSILQEATETLDHATAQYRFRKKDGSYVTLACISITERENGKPVCLVGILQDITEHKQAEEAMRESEERYRGLFENSLEGVFTSDLDGNLTSCNTALEELTGYTWEELSKMKPVGNIAPESSEFVLEQYRKVLSTGKPIRNLVYEMVRKDERRLTVEGYLAPIRKENRIVGFQGAVRDITERKKAEEALRDSEEKLRLTIESVTEGISVSDLEGKIVQVNEAVVKLHGYDNKEELIGRSAFDLIAERDHTRATQNLEKTLKDGYAKNIEYTFLTKDGKEFDAELSSATLRDASGNHLGFIAITRDITERKKAEQELESSRQQLRNLAAHAEATREGERTRIARELHDEMGQALTALKMELSWLNKTLSKDQISLREKTTSMSKLTDNAIQTVKRIAIELRPGILDDLGLAAAVEWQAEEFQRRTGIECEVCTTPEDISLDEGLSTAIFRILQETLTNVARHARATKVKISLQEKDAKLVLEVIDNGRGITEKQISDSKSLGLVGMRERVLPWQGEAEISGIRGEGTTVTVNIPLGEKGEIP